MFPFDYSILRGGKVLSCHMHLTAHEITPTEQGMKTLHCCLSNLLQSGREREWGGLTLQVITCHLERKIQTDFLLYGLLFLEAHT